MNKVFKNIPRILFGKGTLCRIDELIYSFEKKRIVFILDHRIPSVYLEQFKTKNIDIITFPASKGEPTTNQVDTLTEKIKKNNNPEVIVGMGGGSTLDVAKSVSIMLTNPGKSENYQGWDLVKNPPIHKIGIPTLPGSGSEASRTAVLFGPEKKFGINSDYSMFDGLILDSDLMKTLPKDQKFFTGMDCYIHCVESLTGTFINSLSKTYAEKALDLCTNSFLKKYNADEMIVASYLGGASIVNSEVGICHALSYGLSLEFKIRHGIANCIVFKNLGEFYDDHVEKFIKMLDISNIKLPENISKNFTKDILNRMTNMTLQMDKPLTNALGVNWKKIMTPKKIEEIYMKM